MRICLLALLALSAGLAQQPNVVILFADDMGYGDLSSYGNPIIRTPNLDGLAADGLRLTSFYSAPSCVPARTQLLTGRYPQRVKIGGTGAGGKNGLNPRETTLAQALGKAGYHTGMAGKWHLGYAQPEFLPVGKGFDTWFGLPYSNDMIKPWVQTDVPLRLYDGEKRLDGEVDQDTLTERYTDRAVDFIHETAGSDEPFFFYLAYSMPHLPIHAPKRSQGRSRAGLLGDVIETIDWSAGEILAALERAGKADDTLVVFTSDNGPWLNLPARMLQKGNLPWHAGSPGPLRGAKHTTYEGGVRMPAILRWPGTIEAGRVSPETAATIDLFATILAAAGAEPGPLPIDGLDLSDFLAGKTDRSPRQEYFYYHRKTFTAVRQGPWKLHVDENGDAELFHLELDPAERYDRSDEMPEMVKQLRQLMAAKEAEVSRG